MRRKFYDIAIVSDNAKVAHDALDQIGKLYAIEDKIRKTEPEHRKKIRQENSKQIVEDIFANFKIVLTKLPRKSATVAAINYAVNNQVALMRFLDDGKVEINNNAAERAVRCIAIGRKNHLFAGSDAGGETAAVLYSLVETAKLNDINPQFYLAKVLATIQDHKSTKLAELLPWNVSIPDQNQTS